MTARLGKWRQGCRYRVVARAGRVVATCTVHRLSNSWTPRDARRFAREATSTFGRFIAGNISREERFALAGAVLRAAERAVRR